MGYIFNFYTEIIDITSPQVDVDIQDLINNIRDQENSFWDELVANHFTSGTTGKTLKDAKSKATLAAIKNS